MDFVTQMRYSMNKVKNARKGGQQKMDTEMMLLLMNMSPEEISCLTELAKELLQCQEEQHGQTATAC